MAGSRIVSERFELNALKVVRTGVHGGACARAASRERDCSLGESRANAHAPELMLISAVAGGTGDLKGALCV
jgi:hypothetical protein